MRFRNEKELAVVLITLVVFMAFQTFCLIYLDKRISDSCFSSQEFISSQTSIVDDHEKKEKDAVSEQIDETEENTEQDPFQCGDTKESIDKKQSFDYDWDVVCKVITAEAGTDQELCLAVTQCLYNACEKQEWKYTPAEVLVLYKYAKGVDWISTEAKDAFEQVFLNGDFYASVKNATLFYAPRYCKSDWHEQQHFVCEINGVRFFEENG